MANITYPNSFANATVADATQVNANFNAVTAQVNGNLDNVNVAAAAALAQTKIAGPAVDPTVALPTDNTATTDLKVRIDQILHQLKAIINAAGGDWFTAVGAGKSLEELANPPTARVYNDSIIAVANATWTALPMTLERFDTNSIHDTATNNTRLTAKTAGKYLIIGYFRIAQNATGQRLAAIRLNGTPMIARVTENPNSTAVSPELCVSTIWNMALNDYVELYAFQDSGGSLDVAPVDGVSTEFMMVKVSN